MESSIARDCWGGKLLWLILTGMSAMQEGPPWRAEQNQLGLFEKKVPPITMDPMDLYGQWLVQDPKIEVLCF
jgi:hypothetical protein